MRIIAGDLKGRRLHSPAGDQTRPITDMIRGALFNVLGARVRGARFLDLFAGSGSVGLEAVSRGAGHVVWVEASRTALHALRQNVRELAPGLLPAVLPVRVESFLSGGGPAGPGRFDLVFADPPFKDDPAGFVHLVVPWLAPGGRFFLRYHFKTAVPTPPGLVTVFTRKYGDSQLTAYEAEPPESPSSPLPP
ncbi:MAG: 16S rRNA (guanine(966)-N(2))-methyltransferase RsmD [Candidatus Riflebacteria bacterium]|nr:16S rRNA (guanine(966)-N(2))-methyltransferase RsmD [Candidatus Riflebacteria bacterium]